ncbi:MULTISPECIES: restriction endonuclease [unclassified Mesobacillus]|uniref:restriction endonuclease n=1 Tax=unclassified Mesobacillus TaxID=2675270 RepID=UPI00203A6A5F|nr:MULTISPECIES: restriction endonuclease [unclassified Mesobacillus]MCM3124425.1 restriction endonuclease [Mesobacillus sp. MER 33]MCM3234865.1 restriction endonuclease [Mesobacillus sp. MER 48]
MYSVEIRHKGLHKYRVIKGNNLYVVEQKAQLQKKTWDEMWKKKQEAEKKKLEREKMAYEKAQKIALAEQQTLEALSQLELIDNILLSTLGVDDKIDWDSLKDNSEFMDSKPKSPKKPSYPSEPDKKRYEPKFGLMDRILSSSKQKKINESNKLYEEALSEWRKKTDELTEQYEKGVSDFEEKLKKWEERKETFEREQKERNDEIEKKKKQYMTGESEAVIDYCDMVLSNSIYPDYFPQEFDVDYNPVNRTLIVEYNLPDITDLPTLKEVKYVATKDVFKESFITDAAARKMYDKLLYDITLRSIHELFEADVIDAIDSIVFNGWVNTINKATGKNEDICILSIQTNKEEFEEINLAAVDSKSCFKNLKGIGSSKLFSLTPIAPILKINREDGRFVNSYSVTGDVDEETNLAAMDWQDFEHLIRELFEKEFNNSGGEVKITRASKDGGVDAVAFDPDPIRGGKIVIQAKRYTNVVGVSAVRDLYGTVMNEGATKGILVSTADYGPDAYSFAKDKPLTLLNGNNLLHLLQKHGHRAKIDLKEAKLLMKESK